MMVICALCGVTFDGDKADNYLVGRYYCDTCYDVVLSCDDDDDTDWEDEDDV